MSELDFNKELKTLKEGTVYNLYLMYGKEDYLRDIFLTSLKEMCVGDEESFGFYRYDGYPDADTLSSAIDTMPFLSEYSYIEIINCDVNKTSDEIISLLKNIPDYCVISLVCSSGYDLDNRTKAVKFLKSNSHEMNFSAQNEIRLGKWIIKRFDSYGKTIDNDAVRRLIFISGEYMNMLIPEIDKIAGYVKGSNVTVDDVNAVAHHIPEAEAFDIVNLICNKKYNETISLLADMLQSKSSEPIALISALAYQFRQLYASKIGLYSGSDYRSKMVNQSAAKFTKKNIIDTVNLLADADYQIKTSLYSDVDVLKNTVVRIIAENN